MMDKNKQKINSIHKVFETEWFSIDAIPYISSNNQPYYRLSCKDSVSILARTTDKKIILVRQYRPAVEDFTLELPSGYVDDKESPEDAIKRELMEETGFICDKVIPLGSLKIAPSRINNTLYVYFGEGAKPGNTKDTKHREIEVVLVTENKLKKLILEDKYIELAGIAVLKLAKLNGYL